MKHETKQWMDQAEEDFSAAQVNLPLYPKVTAFLCQQAVEKALKAILLKKTGHIRKIHDLVILSREVELPSSLLEPLKELTLAYIYTRYPLLQPETHLKEKVS